jgi:hypothetical protein
MDNWRDRWGGRREQWIEARGDKAPGPNGERRRQSNLGLTSVTPPIFRDLLLDMARSVRSKKMANE